MKYLLIVFVAHKRQEEFVISLAKEVESISSNGVKYFFGEQTILLTFDTKISFEETTDFFDVILGDLSIPYVLSQTDKMTYWFEKENEKHLFGTDLCMENNEYSQDEQLDLRDNIFLGLTDKYKNSYNDGEWEPSSSRNEFYDDNLGITIKLVEETPTLDELLDKINVSGMKSLTEKDKELLNKYSK